MVGMRTAIRYRRKTATHPRTAHTSGFWTTSALMPTRMLMSVVFPALFSPSSPKTPSPSVALKSFSA